MSNTVKTLRQIPYGTARWTLRSGRRTWRLARWVAYFLLPAGVYVGLRATARYLMPRVFLPEARAQFIARVRSRMAPEQAPAAEPAAPPTPTSAPAPPAPLDPVAVATYDRYRDAYWRPEESPEHIADKLARYRSLAADTRTDRVRLMREIARLERMKGDPVKGCLYAVRSMRLLGRDEYDDLTWVRPTLEAAGYTAEAAAAWAMYGRHGSRDAECERYLAAARDRCRRAPAPPDNYTIFEDNRGASDPKVAVIITVYNAADKLPTFLQALQYQTLNRAGGMELIVLDSGSPADEYAAFRQTELRHPIPTLFARTSDRETIQAAWNRGLGLTRAPYVCLLGADENVVPDALTALAGLLDDDPTLDWAQANSLVTEVDRYGALAADVMPYNRNGYCPELVYLESCYVAPVGAVYRKSLHEKVGYFDETFRGAGDTEFKLRMLPVARVKHVPRTLGLFWNYPEERTTQSPRAELEDLRAWYIHRTPAGLRHAYEHRPGEDLERLLALCLRYRKSWCGHQSTDFDLADAVARVLRARLPDSPALELSPGAARVLQAYRALDHLPGVQPDRAARAVAEARRAVDEVQAEHRARPGLGQVAYDVFNDNRHEQHGYYW